ncbi:Rpn family recombination-promoting nuclease/putative transposase [Evtepia sp.]|uniref:Rpn family recombination-promoting nuclease/putative transposase n=1 Tax=Evtepia sp. TaxID=2773933 RepID=UPI002E777E6D|nr:Rpn family recombination-promoting nuclease/putative transposase [Evtepia sp.]
MTVTETMDQKQQEDLARLRQLRLIDDDFFSKCFDNDTACVQLVLQIVLDKPDLNVVDVRTQVFVENLLNRSVRLDVLATDSEGRKFNIEIQRSDKGAGRKRARYNSSMMDVNLLEKGNDFEALPEIYVIFITENDVIGLGEAIYEIERCFVKSGKRFGDGSHILYVNGSYRDDSPVGKLMHDFSCTDPSDMCYNVLADRARFFKESKEGIAVMCKVLDDMRRQSYQEGMAEGKNKNRKETALNLLKLGTISLDDISFATGLSLDEVKKLNEDKPA